MLLEPSPFWVTVLYITGHCQDSQEQVEETKTGQLDICRFGWLTQRGKRVRDQRMQPLSAYALSHAHISMCHSLAAASARLCCGVGYLPASCMARPGHTRIPVVGYAVPGPHKASRQARQAGPWPWSAPFPLVLVPLLLFSSTFFFLHSFLLRLARSCTPTLQQRKIHDHAFSDETLTCRFMQ